jgi:PII-like signaling protein
MRLEGEQALLRLHLSNFVKWHGRPLYEAIVERGRREHLAGATVLTGMAGYFGRGPLLGQHPLALHVERPVVVEFVDRPESLDRFLEGVAPMLEGQPVIITLERAHVVHYRGGERAK